MAHNLRAVNQKVSELQDMIDFYSLAEHVLELEDKIETLEAENERLQERVAELEEA